MIHDWPRPGMTRLLLVLILLVALGMRVPGFYGTLPDIYDHDQVNYVDGALRVGAGDIMGGSFKDYPLSRIVYFLLFVLFGIWFVVGRLTGLYGSLDNFVLAYVVDPSQLLLILRAVMLAVTLGTVWLTYAVGSRLFDRRVGLIASFMMAISFLSVYMTFSKDDVFSAFLILLTLYSAISVVEQPARLSCSVLTGALLGAASATKYFSLLGILLLAVAAWQGSMFQRTSALRAFSIGCAAFIVTFICFVPSAVLDPARFFAKSVVLVTEGNSGVRFSWTLGKGNWYGYLWSTYAATVGVVFTSLFYVAAVLMLWKRVAAGALLLVYPLALTGVLTVAVIVGRGAEAPHYALSAVPFMCVAVGYLLVRLSVSSVRLSRWTVPVLVMLVAFGNVRAAWTFDRIVSAEDSRTVVRKWIEDHVPADSSILLEGAIHTFVWEGPQLRENQATLERDLKEIRQWGGSGRMVQAKLRALDRVQLRWPTYDLYRVDDVTSKDLTEVRADYVVVRSEGGRKVVEDSPEKHRLVFSALPKTPQLFRFLVHLTLADLQRLHEMPLFGSDSRSLMSGPPIWVYRLDDTNKS